MELIGYHGTDQSNESKIIKNPDIPKIIIAQEVMRNKKRKIKPGSLGYGFYVFEKDKELAETFAKRFCENPKVLEVKIDLEDDKVLDFDDIDDREAFHQFRKNYMRTAKILYEKLDADRFNIKQHVFDGIVVEGLINSFERQGNEVNAVTLSTYTPTTNNEKMEEFSFIPNGTEYCIKKNKIIKEINAI